MVVYYDELRWNKLLFYIKYIMNYNLFKQTLYFYISDWSFLFLSVFLICQVLIFLGVSVINIINLIHI